MKRLALLAVLAFPAFSWADIIVLRDGTQLEGEAKRSGDNYIVKTADGTKIVPMDKVASFQVKAQGGADASLARLQSLRRAVENVSDPRQVIARYKTFLDQNPTGDISEVAKREMQTWQDRADRGLIKVGDKWMTPAERDALRSKSSDLAIQLHDMVKQGRLKESRQILERSIVVDPKNPSLNYLLGVINYSEEQIPASRKAFETTSAAAPDHAPTLNNLAVVMWRQRAHAASLGYYDRALLAAPGTRDLLDNVTEALHALPKELHDAGVTKKLLRHYKEQEDDMEKAMAAKDMVRWGATWVTTAELKKLQADEATIKGQLAAMDNDYNAIAARIAALDQQIVQVDNQMKIIDAQTYQTTASGQVVRLPYPPQWYQLGQQMAQMKTERANLLNQVDRLRGAARQAQASLPSPKFTGNQKLVDADGMPLPAGVKLPPPVAAPAQPAAAAPAPAVPATAPATNPATAPAPAAPGIAVPKPPAP